MYIYIYVYIHICIYSIYICICTHNVGKTGKTKNTQFGNDKHTYKHGDNTVQGTMGTAWSTPVKKVREQFLSRHWMVTHVEAPGMDRKTIGK